MKRVRVDLGGVGGIGHQREGGRDAQRGGIVNFAVVAEPPNYDCHASQTFALPHPVSPMYSYLVKYDSSLGERSSGDPTKAGPSRLMGHLYAQAARGGEVP